MKQKNSKIRWLIFIGIVLLVAIVIFCIWLPYKNKTKAPGSNQNLNTNQNQNVNTNSEVNSNTSNLNNNQTISLQKEIDQYSQAIKTDPNNPDNYINKSEAEYQNGDKQAALVTVNEGLKVAPNNDLLRARLEILQKETFNQIEGQAKP